MLLAFIAQVRLIGGIYVERLPDQRPVDHADPAVVRRHGRVELHICGMPQLASAPAGAGPCFEVDTAVVAVQIQRMWTLRPGLRGIRCVFLCLAATLVTYVASTHDARA